MTPPANAGGVIVSKTRESSSGPQSSRASIESGGVRLSKSPGELVRAAALSSFNRIRRLVRRIRGNFFGGELAPGEEIASLRFPRPEMRSISAETARGWKWRGSLLPRHQLVCGHGSVTSFRHIGWATGRSPSRTRAGSCRWSCTPRPRRRPSPSSSRAAGCRRGIWNHGFRYTWCP